ncbi:MAG: dTDP-4-dehydrorhamnose reductase [Candidatus Omnitrophota bacterium]
MKLLVTGAAGMLAAEVIKVFLDQGHDIVQTDINQRLPDIKKLDVSDSDEVFKRVEAVRPDYVFHLAAETNVDLCEQDPDHAFKVNTLGTENIALACKKFKTGLLYISTGGIFGGEKEEPYTELDEPCPVSVYGKSKLQGEIIVRDIVPEHFIIRAGWMVGGWELDKKFVYKIVQQLKEGKKEIKAVSDKFGSPTFTKDFALNLTRVIETKKYGTYHMANKGSCSRYDMAVKIVDFMGLKGEVEVKAVDSSEFPLPASRARSEMMMNYKLDLLGINNMPDWKDSLKNYIEENSGRLTVDG